jgi:hypothetical protein
MRWGLVPGHNLATPFVVARPLEVDTIIQLFSRRWENASAYLDTDEGRMTGPDWSREPCIQ